MIQNDVAKKKRLFQFELSTPCFACVLFDSSGRVLPIESFIFFEMLSFPADGPESHPFLCKFTSTLMFIKRRI